MFSSHRQFDELNQSASNKKLYNNRYHLKEYANIGEAPDKVNDVVDILN